MISEGFSLMHRAHCCSPLSDLTEWMDIGYVYTLFPIVPKQLELGGNDYIFFGSYLACVTLVHSMNSYHEKNAIHEKMITFFLIFFHLSA